MRQMERIGSNKHINIAVQIDKFGKNEVTHYRVEKGKSVAVRTVTKPPESISGTPENLYHFVKETITHNPAKHNALILWNHGAGIKDPHIWSRNLPYRRDECFFLNQKTKLYEIRRDLFQEEFFKELGNTYMGIAFNDTGRAYLTNNDLKETLEKINAELLGGKKLDILGMDACHMAMVEIGAQIKSSAIYMVGSQEIEPGRGWDYSQVLKKFKTGSMTPKDFAVQIVDAYGAQYNNSFADLTHSAVDLTNYEALEQNIDTTAKALLDLIKKPAGNKIYQLISQVRKGKATTTTFLDPDYIDLNHFYKSLRKRLDGYKPAKEQIDLVEKLKTTLDQGQTILASTVIKNISGRSAKNACGLSIYFPVKSLHTSYLKTEFAKNTHWCPFLYIFLKKARRSHKN
jgi:hypothetical protein